MNVLLWFLSEPGRRKALSLCCELWGGERLSLIKCKEKGVFCLREPVVALISKTPCFLISGLSLDPGPGNEIKDFFLKGKCLRWFFCRLGLLHHQPQHGGPEAQQPAL